MKTIVLLSLLLAFTAVTRADDPKPQAPQPKGGQTLMQVTSPRPETETKTAPVTPPKPATQVPGRPVTYGGYFTDLVKAEKKRPLFSLRAPIDPQKDTENLSYYPGTDKIQGIIFFSLKF